MVEPYIAGRFPEKTWSWTGHQERLYPTIQRADYESIVAPEGRRLRGLEFALRPDYPFEYWRAGFRLGPKDENVETTGITDTFLFHVWMNAWGPQPDMLLFVQGKKVEGGLRSWASGRWPTFVIRANLWPVPNSPRMRLTVSVDNADGAPMEAEFDASYAERVLLLGWGDGNRFRAL